jgi:hypothetical protein
MTLFLGPNGQTYGPLIDDNTFKQMQADGAVNRTPVSQPQIRYGGGLDGPGSQGNGPGITALQSRPVSQQQVRPLGLLYNSDGSYPTDRGAMPLTGALQPQAMMTQRQSGVRHPNRYSQILASVQKRKAMPAAAKGGVIRKKYADGSQPQITQQQVAMIVTMLKKGADMDTIASITGVPAEMVQSVISRLQQNIQQKAKGGITEIDYRDKGGYVPPIGKKERADDIPAMLSNNEFVFTAKAVRNAGGGSVKKGAKKMYALMKKLEGKI